MEMFEILFSGENASTFEAFLSWGTALILSIVAFEGVSSS